MWGGRSERGGRSGCCGGRGGGTGGGGGGRRRDGGRRGWADTRGRSVRLDHIARADTAGRGSLSGWKERVVFSFLMGGHSDRSSLVFSLLSSLPAPGAPHLPAPAPAPEALVEAEAVGWTDAREAGIVRGGKKKKKGNRSLPGMQREGQTDRAERRLRRARLDSIQFRQYIDHWIGL